MLIRVQNVSKSYQQSSFRLENISFTVSEGEVVGIIGRNGTGKSTILKMVNGLIDHDGGQVFYQEKALKSMSSKELRAMRQEIAYIFQQHNLLLGETVYYHLALVYKLSGQKVDKKAIDDILTFMGMSNHKFSKCLSLSGGQQQKVAIAMAILQKPKLILCDEISAALDTNSEREIFELLAKLRQERGIAILMIAHQLPILKHYCDRVLIVDHQTIAETIVPVKGQRVQTDEDYVQQVKEFLLND